MYIFPYFISLDLILLKINAAQLSENIESRVQLTIDCFIATQLSQSSQYFQKTFEKIIKSCKYVAMFNSEWMKYLRKK